VIPVPVVDFDAERSFDEDRFGPQLLAETDRPRVACGCAEPGQSVPVHAPGSDAVVEADTKRGVRADEDARLEALLVASPPPSEAEHERVQRGGFTPSGDAP